jgi:hypothetical protein
VEHLFFILSDATVETEARGRWELGPAGNLLKVAKNRNFANNADLIGSRRNCLWVLKKSCFAKRAGILEIENVHPNIDRHS